MKGGKTTAVVVYVIVLLWFSLFLAKKIDLTTADLGRHIKNGEIILSSVFWNSDGKDIFNKNFYSYASPDFPVVNHHWGSGVVFYLLFSSGGFLALHFFYILVYVLTFGIFFNIAKKEAGNLPALALSMLLIPLMASRAEIRPEVFSYLFSAIFFYICFYSKKGGISQNWLYLLIPLSFIWANLHIAFFFGFIIMGAFLMEAMFSTNSCFKKLAVSFIFSLFAVILNPNGLTGALEPLNIFREYGYLVVENQSIGFLEKLNHTAGLNFLLFKFSLLILVLSFVFVLIKKRKSFSLSGFFLAAIVSFMAYMGIRNFPFFGFFSLPILAGNIKISNLTNKTILILATVIIIIGLFQGTYYFYSNKNIMGLGLIEGVNNSAEFFLKNNIKGPVFNNYDIGGYLIYNLYPKHKVFTDNRPEAYSVSFFKDIYVPAQEDNQKWEELDRQYNFNAVFFSWRDYTPWGQNFLIQRVSDKNWAPVFADRFNIIFVKKTEENKILIEKYELPKKMFNVKENK